MCIHSCSIGGLVRILDLRTYRCRISYLPSTSSSVSVRGRAECNGDHKRRHLSESVLKSGLGSDGGGGGDATSKKGLKGRRRSTTEAERMSAANRLRNLEGDASTVVAVVDGDASIVKRVRRLVASHSFPIQ